MGDRLVKVVGKHRKNCVAVRLSKKGEWDTPWGPIVYGEHGEPIVTTWRRYGKNGRVLRTWVRFMCNNSGCRAELHVEANFILRAAKKLGATSTRGDG